MIRTGKWRRAVAQLTIIRNREYANGSQLWGVGVKQWMVVLVGLAGSMISGAAAWADPRLDEIVYSPYVENHVFELETRVGQELGQGDLEAARTFVVEAEAGLNDRTSLALVTSIEREPGISDRLTGVGLEGIYYVGQIPRVGVDVGGYLEVTKGLGGEPDRGEAKLLLAKTAGRFQGLLNFIVEEPFDASAGQNFASYGYAASAAWRTWDNLRLGVEAFGDFGDDHGLLQAPHGFYVGPQVKWEGTPPGSPVEINVDAGWLAALGPDRAEAASQFRISLELEHRF
jgi:hypothetical protein